MKNLTLGKLVDQYLKKEKTEKQPYGNTKKSNLNRIRRMLGKVLLPSLTFDCLTSFVDERENQGAGGVTIGMDIAEIAAVVRSARKENKYDFDMKVFAEVHEHMHENDLDTKSKHRDKRPTDQELTMLKKYFDEKERQQIPMSTIIDFAVFTGMRASEITRIKRADVDFDKKNVIIRDRKHPKKKRDQTVPLS